MTENEDGSKRWTLERWMLVGTFILTSLGFTFGLGVNWQRITRVEADIAANEKTYLRVDVYSADQQGLKDSVDRLTRALERIEQRTPQQPQVFGR